MWKKFETLEEIIGNKIDTLLIHETKLENKFLLSHFTLYRFTSPNKLDRTEHGEA